MLPTILQNPIFQDETKAREWLEARVWPEGPVCPHCGSLTATGLRGEAHRPGVYQCNDCREQFTVTVKTVFERSKLPLTKWLAALFLMTGSKKGISAHQIHRTLKISYKSAWFMMHRLREAMRQGDLVPPMGGSGEIVEVDETYFGKQAGHAKGKRQGHMNAVLSLVTRGGGSRTFHVDGTRIADIAPVIRENISRESKLMTDTASWYTQIGKGFARHDTINHTDDEYVRYTNAVQFPSGEPYTIHTNTVEGFFSIFKRGMKGVYQHCSEKHLHRYLAEFDFRYSHRVRLGYTDEARAAILANGIKGKRLTYRRPHGSGEAEAT
jgi:transposase-like protein